MQEVGLADVSSFSKTRTRYIRLARCKRMNLFILLTSLAYESPMYRTCIRMQSDTFGSLGERADMPSAHQHVASLADVAQLVEHHHGKVGVAGSIPAIGSKTKRRVCGVSLWPMRAGLGERGRENGSFPVTESSESSSAENREVVREEYSTTVSCHRLQIVLGRKIRYKFNCRHRIEFLYERLVRRIRKYAFGAFSYFLTRRCK